MFVFQTCLNAKYNNILVVKSVHGLNNEQGYPCAFYLPILAIEYVFYSKLDWLFTKKLHILWFVSNRPTKLQ